MNKFSTIFSIGFFILIFWGCAEEETRLICEIDIPEIEGAALKIYLKQEFMEPNGALSYEAFLNDQLMATRYSFSGINGTTEKEDFTIYTSENIVGVAWIEANEIVILCDFEKQIFCPSSGRARYSDKGKEMLGKLQALYPDLKFKY